MRFQSYLFKSEETKFFEDLLFEELSLSLRVCCWPEPVVPEPGPIHFQFVESSSGEPEPLLPTVFQNKIISVEKKNDQNHK